MFFIILKALCLSLNTISDKDVLSEEDKNKVGDLVISITNFENFYDSLSYFCVFLNVIINLFDFF